MDYEIVHYQRNKATNLAPDSLKKVHPLGRAPILTTDELVLAESAVIIEYLIKYHDSEAKFVVSDDIAVQQNYAFWMHFAEGSLMPSMVTKMVLNKGKSKVGLPFSLITDKFVDGVNSAYFGPNLDTSIAYVEQHLAEHHGFIGDHLCAVDFQMIFPLEALVAAGHATRLPAITAYVQSIHQREAYKRALSKGGEYAYATSV